MNEQQTQGNDFKDKKILIFGSDDRPRELLMKQLFGITPKLIDNYTRTQIKMTISGQPCTINCITELDLMGPAPYARDFFQNLSVLIFCPTSYDQISSLQTHCQKFLEQFELSLVPIIIVSNQWPEHSIPNCKLFKTRAVNENVTLSKLEVSEIMTKMFAIQTPLPQFSALEQTTANSDTHSALTSTHVMN